MNHLRPMAHGILNQMASCLRVSRDRVSIMQKLLVARSECLAMRLPESVRLPLQEALAKVGEWGLSYGHT